MPSSRRSADTVGYYVLRDDAPAGGDCGTQASPIASVTCTDTVLASATPMTYAYEVVAVWRSWTSTSDSVDVLVKATQTIVFTSTAPSSAKVGGSTYEVTATGGGSGNPVTFTIDPSASSVCSIAGSTVSFAAVGTCTVNANQAGGSSYEPAGQVQQSFAVSKGDQAIVFTSTAPSSAKVGGSTYEVTATGGGSGNPVTFTIDPSASSVCSIAGSTVSFTAVGTCTVNANQAGGSNYEPAGQVQQSFAVAKGDQTIGFDALTDRRFDEGPVTVSATASSGLTVSFSSATPGVCTVAGTSVTFVSVGTCTVNANQGGDSNWNAAPQVQQSFQVTKGDQTIGFGALTDRRFDESPVTVSATASSGLTVSFSSATPGVCTVAGTSVTFVSVGACTVNANQGGDSNWNAAPQVQQSFQVTKGNQTVAFTSPAPGAAKVGGPTYTPSGTATSGLAVSPTIDPSSSSVCSIAAGAISFNAVGTCTVNANQPGNGNWNSAPQVQQSFSVAKGDQSVSFTSSAPGAATAGGGTYTAAATATSGLTVTFSSATPSICSSGGTNGSTISFVGSGTCTVNATQGGDTNWNPAPQAQQTFSVAKASPTLSVSAPATGTAGTVISAASITATLAASSGSNATSTITFRVFGPQASAPTTCAAGGTTVGTATPAGDGTYASGAAFTPSSAGTYWWYVSSTDDANNNAASSACDSAAMTKTVVATAATRLSFTSCTASSGSSANCATVGTATVTLRKANQGGGSWTGRVTLMDAAGNPIVNTTGSAILVTVSKTAAGATVTYSAGTALTIPAGSSASSNTFTYDNLGVSNGGGSDTVTGASSGLTSAVGNVSW